MKTYQHEPCSPIAIKPEIKNSLYIFEDKIEKNHTRVSFQE